MKIKEILLRNGMNSEEVNCFAKLPKHNSKKDIFRKIAGMSKLPKNPKSLEENLVYALFERGIYDIEELMPEKNSHVFNYLGEERYRLFVAQKIASLAIKVLNSPRYKQYDNSLTIDRIYEETLKEIKSRGGIF